MEKLEVKSFNHCVVLGLYRLFIKTFYLENSSIEIQILRMDWQHVSMLMSSEKAEKYALTQNQVATSRS